MLHDLTDGTITPIEARFSLGTEDDAAIHGRLLGMPVRLNHSRTGVILDAAAMETALPGADAVERHRLLALIQDPAWTTGPDFAAKVSHAIRHQLHYDGASMPAVTGELGLHPRTLRRRLHDEGQTFERLRDGVRFAVARELLELTDIPVAEVGAFLGFVTPGVFSRAFRRWSGTSPSLWLRSKQT